MAGQLGGLAAGRMGGSGTGAEERAGKASANSTIATAGRARVVVRVAVDTASW